MIKILKIKLNIEYFYYNKTDSYNKDEIKLDNKGIKLIYNFVKIIYVKFGNVVNYKKDELKIFIGAKITFV